MKRNLSLAIVLALLVSLSSFYTAFAEENLYGEHLEITWMGYTGNQGAPIPQDDRIKPYIEEKFNVTITKAEVDWTSKEAVTLYFAEGNTADVMFIRQLQRDQLVDEQLIRSFDEELLYEYMPDWMALVEGVVGKEVVQQQLYYDGEVWGVPYTAENRVAPNSYLINKTWLEASGATQVPQTLDELHDYLYFCTFGDPDGNGENDTWGMGAIGVTGLQAFSVIWSAFDVVPSAYYETDGKIVAACQTENYKKALELLAKWFAEGIIYPEFATMKDYGNDYYDTCVDVDENGNGPHVGLMWMPVATYLDDRLLAFNTYCPDIETEIFFNVEGIDGERRACYAYPNLYTNAYPYYFGYDTSDEKMIRCMQILNAFCTDPELALMTNYGEVEEHGANWILGDDGVYHANAEWNVANEGRSALDGAMDARCFYAVLPSVKKPIQTVSTATLDALEYTRQFNVTYTDRDFGFNGMNTSYSTYSTDINAIEDEFVLNVILGRKSIENDYDAFMAEWLSAGGQSVVDEYQMLYDSSK